MEKENIRLEEDLHYLNKAIWIAKRDPVFRCDTNLEPDLEKQRNEEVLNEKSKVTSKLIDMKAELEQEKQRSAKKLQEKDQDLTESFKLFDDLKNESLKKYKEYVEILQEKDQALAEASKQLINMKADGVASEKDFKSELVKRLEEDLRLQMKHNAALQSKLTEQTSLAKELAKENLQLNEELLEFRRVNCTLSKPKVEEDVKVNSFNESGFEVLDLEGVNQRNLELLYEKGKAISELIDMKADLEQEKLKNAKFLQEKDQAFTVALKNFIDMKNKNSDLKNESLKWRRKNLETEEILQEKDQALTKAFQNFIDMKAESLELDRDKVQNTEIEDMKQLIEVEILMSENLKLTKEITFLNTNAQVNDLELTRMRTELEKGGSKEQEMVKLLYQKDEAITKANSELVQMKQNITRLKNSECCADPEIQRNLKIILNTAVSRNKALFEANAEDDKVASLNIEIESLNDAFNIEVERLNGAFSQANKETLKVVQDMERVISEAKSKEKRNVQEIVKYVIEIERLKEELKHEKYLNECLERTRFRHEDKMSVNLDNIKVNISEFMVMKDMIRNNIQVKFLNATIE